MGRAVVEVVDGSRLGLLLSGGPVGASPLVPLAVLLVPVHGGLALVPWPLLLVLVGGGGYCGLLGVDHVTPQVVRVDLAVQGLKLVGLLLLPRPQVLLRGDGHGPSEVRR